MGPPDYTCFAPPWQPLETDLFDPVSRRSDIVAARVAPAPFGSAMLADKTFVAWPLPGQFGEFNRLDFKVSMAKWQRNSPSIELVS